MRKLLAILGMTIGGWVGWEVGAFVSIFTAFIVSVIGTGVGLYMANRLAGQYLP